MVTPLCGPGPRLKDDRGDAAGAGAGEGGIHRVRTAAPQGPARRGRDADPLVQHPPRPPDASPAAAAPGHRPAGRPRRPLGDLPDGPHRPGGVDRAVHRHPAGGAGRLPALAALAPVPGPPAREGPRHPGAHLLQVRGRLAGRVAQAEHRGAAGVLQRARRHPEAHDRDRCGPVGHVARLRVRAVRPRVRDLAGAGLLRRQALPQDHDGDLRRHGAPEPVRPHRGRPHDARERPRLPRLARPGDQRGRRGRRPGPQRQLRPRLGAQPRAAAPDDHRRGGPAPAREDRRDRRPHRRVHRRRLELRRPDLPVHPREARRGRGRAR